VALALEFHAKLLEAAAEPTHRWLAIRQGPGHKKSFGINPSPPKDEVSILTEFFPKILAVATAPGNGVDEAFIGSNVRADFLVNVWKFETEVDLFLGDSRQVNDSWVKPFVGIDEDTSFQQHILLGIGDDVTNLDDFFRRLVEFQVQENEVHLAIVPRTAILGPGDVMALTLAEQQVIDSLFQKLLLAFGFRPDSLPDSISSVLSGTFGPPLANTLSVLGSVSGSPVSIVAGGSDTNIGLSLLAKGTGNYSFSTAVGGPIVVFDGPAGVNGFVWNGPGNKLICTANLETQGILNVFGNLSFVSSGSVIQITGAANPLTLKSNVLDGASAVEIILDGFNALANATAKLLSIRNAGVEKYAIDLNGKDIVPTGGAAAVVGVSAAMSGTPGSVTINTTAVTATSIILYAVQTAGGTQGNLRVSARVAGTSFTITSTANETSTIGWQLIN